MAVTHAVMLRVRIKILLIFCIKGPMFTSNSVCYLFVGIEEIQSINVEPNLVNDSLFIFQVNKNIHFESKLSLQLSLQLLLLLSGDIETCPGPTTTFAEFANLRGMKIIHQNICGLFHNLSYLSAVLTHWFHHII